MPTTKAFDLHTNRLLREPVFEEREVGRFKKRPASEIEVYDLVKYVRGQSMIVHSVQCRRAVTVLTGVNKFGMSVRCELLHSTIVGVCRLT